MAGPLRVEHDVENFDERLTSRGQRETERHFGAGRESRRHGHVELRLAKGALPEVGHVEMTEESDLADLRIREAHFHRRTTTGTSPPRARS